MQAIIVQGGASNSAEGLKLGESPTPEPRQGQCLVKVKAFGLNRMDILQRKSAPALPPDTSPILGVEFSGIVVSSHSGKFDEGDEVFGLAFGGAYAEFIAVDERMVSKKPHQLSWVQAAAVPENWLTAYQTLFLNADLKPGESVLVHAGASGVGIAANQLAHAFGASKVFTTAGTPEKVRWLEDFGANTVAINYKTQDFAKEIEKATDGKGVDVVVDFVGKDYWEQNLASLAKDGRMVILGLLSGGQAGPSDLSQILYKRLRIQGSTLRYRTLEYQAELLSRFTTDVLPKILGECPSGQKLQIVVHRAYSWEDIIGATQEMEQARNTGKIVCTIG